MPDQSLRIAIRIEHGQKVGQQLAAGVLDREIFLVIAHHSDQYFFGQCQELEVKGTQDGGRKLCEIDDGVEQGLVFAPASAGNRPSGCIESLANLLLTLRAPQHLGSAQRVHVGRTGSGNVHRRIGQNAMPARLAAGGNAIELKRNGLAIQHRHQPTHRTHKALVRLAPVHILRPINSGDFFRQTVGQDLRGGAAFLRDLRGQVLALRSRDSL